MTPAHLLTLIGASAAEARTIGHIAEHAGVSRREVEAAIQAARLDGHPIVSGDRGVHLAQSAQEARSAANALRRRYITQAIVARAMRRAARRMAAAEAQLEQLPLFEEEAA
jgi:hypothetical protein